MLVLGKECRHKVIPSLDAASVKLDIPPKSSPGQTFLETMHQELVVLGMHCHLPVKHGKIHLWACAPVVFFKVEHFEFFG